MTNTEQPIRVYEGSLFIHTREDAQRYAAIERVTGFLFIRADAQLPALVSVGGSLYISADAQLPALVSVGGYLSIRSEAQLPALTSVGGFLYIAADAQLPALTSVGGFLSIRAYADAQLPALTSVGGRLYTDSDAQLPALASVEGCACTLPPIWMYLDPWPVIITDEHMRIGCQRHTLKDWEAFTDGQIDAMDEDALDWWCEHKDTLLQKARDAGRVF